MIYVLLSLYTSIKVKVIHSCSSTGTHYLSYRLVNTRSQKTSQMWPMSINQCMYWFTVYAGICPFGGLIIYNQLIHLVTLCHDDSFMITLPWRFVARKYVVLLFVYYSLPKPFRLQVNCEEHLFIYIF